jgi:hypothetical protein
LNNQTTAVGPGTSRIIRTAHRQRRCVDHRDDHRLRRLVSTSVSDTPDDQAPTDPWGNPLPPDQWPEHTPPPPTPPTPPAGSEQAGWAQPDYGQYPQQNWSPQGYAPPGHPLSYGSAPGYGQPPKTEGMAIGALVCGILGTLCGVIGCFGLLIGPVGIVLGVVARRRIRESGGMTKGEGLALAGLVLGIIGTVASVGWLIAFATVPELRDRLNELTSTTTTRP